LNALIISLIAFSFIFCGALLGIYLRRTLPSHHLYQGSKDIMKLAMGLTATMSALVLGLLVASAKDSYSAKRGEIMQMAAKVMYLDGLLTLYGPEAQDARTVLGEVVEGAVRRVWPAHRSRFQGIKPVAAGAFDLYKTIQSLTPRDNNQRTLQTEALRICFSLAQDRWMLYEQSGGFVLIPFVVMLVFWFVLIFVSFGILAPENSTAKVFLLMSAITVSSAIFLILELDQPFQGLLRFAGGPILSTLEQVGR
jgi:hypothetical protein